MKSATRAATGPTTPAGKSKMRDNPLKHGLTAKHVVIKGEDAAEYDALRLGLMESYLPSTVAEAVLVTQIAEGYWRLMRARKMETEFWDTSMMTPQEHPKYVPGQVSLTIPKTYEGSMLQVFHRRAADLDRLNRYLTTLERAYYKAIKEFQKEQSLRAERIAESAIESVSQNAPELPIRQFPSTTQPANEPRAAASRPTLSPGDN